MELFAEIHAPELGLKAKSKKEVYDLLCNEGGIYFPPIDDAHHKYISQVIVGDKLHLKCKDIKVCRVPHLKGLTVDDLLKFGMEETNLIDYLPEYEYRKLPHRQWLCNVLNTLLGDTFTKFVQDRLEDRAKFVVRKKELNAKALPEFASIFNKSQNISVQKGRSHYLLIRCGKRKWDQIEDDDKERLKKANVMITDLNKEI